MQLEQARQHFRQTVETFTPERAADILEHKNPRNRTVVRRNVDYLKGIIRSTGGLAVANDSICFDWFGNLINGQHRLIAVKETGVAITQPVTYGLAPETFLAMDRGVVRTLATDFQMDKFPYSAGLAAAVNILIRFDEKRMMNNHRKVSPAEAQSFLAANPKLYDIVRSTHSSTTRRRSWITSPATASAAWFIFDRVDAEWASEFMERWSDGAGLEVGNAILALRTNLLNRKSQLGVTLLQTHTVAIAIKAWNSFRAGRRTTMLKFLPTEEFPIPA